MKLLSKRTGGLFRQLKTPINYGENWLLVQPEPCRQQSFGVRVLLSCPQAGGSRGILLLSTAHLCPGWALEDGSTGIVQQTQSERTLNPALDLEKWAFVFHLMKLWTQSGMKSSRIRQFLLKADCYTNSNDETPLLEMRTFGLDSSFPRAKVSLSFGFWAEVMDKFARFLFSAWQEAAVKLFWKAVPSLPSGLSKQEVCFCFLLITNTSSIPNQHFILDQIPVSSSTWSGSICFQYNLNWRTINKIGFRPQSRQNPGIDVMCRLALQSRDREWWGEQ